MNLLNSLTHFKILSLAIITFSFGACSKADSGDYTITVGAFTKDESGDYVDTGNTLIFNSTEECQTWSRTAGADAHDAESHLHYNAAAAVSFDSKKTEFTWTEYGPELDQSSIDATCASGTDGVTKTVDDSDYYQDKPNLYLKITNVEEL